MDLKTERSIREALSEVHRELCVRERCFDRWVTDGKMTDVDAQDRYDRMASAKHYLESYALVLKQHFGQDGTTVDKSIPISVTSSGDMTDSAVAL